MFIYCLAKQFSVFVFTAVNNAGKSIASRLSITRELFQGSINMMKT